MTHECEGTLTQCDHHNNVKQNTASLRPAIQHNVPKFAPEVESTQQR